MALGVSMVSGKLPVRYACASASSPLLHALALQAPELVHHQPQRFAGHFRARVGVGNDVARVLEGIDVRRRAIGQPAIRAQHTVQPVAAFTAEDVDREIERQVVLVPARKAHVADADLGLHRARPIDDHDTPCRRGRIDGLGHGRLGFAPLAERPFGAGKRLFVADVPDDGENRVVGAEPGLVERDEIVPGDARDRIRSARVRAAVGMESVDQPVEHHPGDVVRVLVADLEPRQDLLTLSLELLRRELRVSRQVRHHVEPEARSCPSSRSR